MREAVGLSYIMPHVWCVQSVVATMDEWTNLVFGTEASLGLSYTVL